MKTIEKFRKEIDEIPAFEEMSDWTKDFIAALRRSAYLSGCLEGQKGELSYQEITDEIIKNIVHYSNHLNKE